VGTGSRKENASKKVQPLDTARGIGNPGTIATRKTTGPAAELEYLVNARAASPSENQVGLPHQCAKACSGPARSRIAIGRRNRSTESRQAEEQEARRQIEKLAQQLSWAPPSFALLVR
jgi:hypothetical protein